MKTKTIKTPSVGLTLILSICDKCYDSVFKSRFYARVIPLDTTTAVV